MGGGRASTELPQNAARHDGGSGLNNNMHWPAEQSVGGISTEYVWISPATNQVAVAAYYLRAAIRRPARISGRAGGRRGTWDFV
jgi:hypothetical protein